MAIPDLPPRCDLRGRSLQLAILAAAVVFWGVPFAIGTASKVLFEDAMIVLRYARHIAGGEGFVFNLGEKVLGVTTPLQTLLSTLPFLAGAADPPAWQNLAGLAFLVAEAVLLLLIARGLGLLAAALPIALLALGGFYGGYLYLGMETHLFTALILLASLLALGPFPSETEPGHPRATDVTSVTPAKAGVQSEILFSSEAARPCLLGVVLGLAFLTRYDAALLAGLLGVEAWWRTRRFPWRMTVAFFATVAPWLLFAQLYFGSILPQPLAAKESYFGSSAYLGQVYAYWKETARAICAVFSRIDRANHLVAISLPLIAAAGALLLAFRARWDSRRGVVAVLAAYPFLHLTVYAALGPDPAFAWHYYLLGPFVLLFGAALATTVLSALRERLAPRLPERLAASALALVLLFPIGWHLYKQATYRYQPDPHSQQLRDMGLWLAERYPPSTSLLQPSIGILGYVTGFRMIDHAGLVTPGLYFWNDRDCTPVAEVIERFHPGLVLASPWTQATPEQMAAAGYRAVHTFAPFEYVVYERASVGRSMVGEAAP